MSTWLDSFLQKRSSEFFVRVDEDYLQDSFNLFGIKDRMTYFKEATNLLLNDQISQKVSDPKLIKKKAAILYGQIHQRFLSTPDGLEKMYKKYKKSHFPKCPRVYCKGVSCFPYGVTDQLGEHKLMFYCPGCNDVYKIQLPEIDKVDGAYFGPSYVHMLFQKYPDVIPNIKHQTYVPTVFGFRMCKESDVEVTNDDDSDL
ncbi:hypothetical protein M9Y10_005625 [Tritrichomonas musculus]|uniref:Casein kinase II subunit beta n=1 Tax=Tritrichomonas musculus TaxID=1915356 RepID=A0ABR2JCP9_9EUKA